MWIKYRHKSSAGRGEWEWKHCTGLDFRNKDDKEYIKSEIIDEMARENDWSEHYRGIDYECLDEAPREIIEKEIDLVKRTIKSYETELKRLQAELDGCKQGS